MSPAARRVVRSIETQTFDFIASHRCRAPDLSFFGPTLAAAPPHPMPYVLGGAGISERPQTPPAGPTRDPRVGGTPLPSPFWLRGAYLGY